MRFILLIAFFLGLNSCGGGGGGDNSTPTTPTNQGTTSPTAGDGTTKGEKPPASGQGTTKGEKPPTSGQGVINPPKPIVIIPIIKPTLSVVKPIKTTSIPIISIKQSAKIINSFNFSGDNNWTKVDGIWGSYKIVDEKSSCIDYNITSIVYSKLSFYSKVSSELSSDTFSFHLDGEKKYHINGEDDWKKRVYILSNGKHNLKWCYTKDDSTSNGSDKAWLKDINLTEIITVSENSLANYIIGNLTISLDANVTSFEVTGDGKDNFSISNDGQISLLKRLDYETKSFYTIFVRAINNLGKSNTLDINISVLNEDDLYIKTAVLDNNILNIYFSKEIKTDTINSTSLNNYNIFGIGSLGANSSGVYNALWQRDSITLNSGFTPFVANETNISIKSNTILDKNSVSADSSKTTIIKRYSLKKTYQKSSYGVDGSEIYDGSIKDDGYYKRGVVGQYISNKDKTTIIDTVTGILWQDNNSSSTMGWTNAKNYCNNLILDTLSDWRLPTIKELQSVDKNTFRYIGTDRFWSSNINIANTSNAWVLNLNSQDTQNTDKTANLYVKCVH